MTTPIVAWIALAPDKTFRGPLSAAPELAAGETPIELAAAQYIAFDTLRKANRGAKLIFDGSNFALSPGQTILNALGAILSAQPYGVQSFFKPIGGDVKTLLQTGAGQIAEAKEVVATVPLFGDPALTAVQASMLGCFP